MSTRKAPFLVVISAAVLALALSGCAGAAPSAAPTPAASATQEEHHWTYDDPSAWEGECMITERSAQSPVDLPAASDLDAEELRVVIDFAAQEFTAVNNGHTVTVTPVGDATSSVTLGDSRYVLDQFHLHTPSEHTVAGDETAMELHLVFHNQDSDRLVIAVLLSQGDEPNSTLAELFTAIPTQLATEGAETGLTTPIDPGALLPADLVAMHYNGSLTTPPCTESVHWIVLEETASLSAEQHAAFARLYPQNRRPVTPLNDRVVTEVQLSRAG